MILVSGRVLWESSRLYFHRFCSEEPRVLGEFMKLFLPHHFASKPFLLSTPKRPLHEVFYSLTSWMLNFTSCWAWFLDSGLKVPPPPDAGNKKGLDFQLAALLLNLGKESERSHHYFLRCYGLMELSTWDFLEARLFHGMLHSLLVYICIYIYRYT